jgi:hypothetical protein
MRALLSGLAHTFDHVAFHYMFDIGAAIRQHGAFLSSEQER